ADAAQRHDRRQRRLQPAGRGHRPPHQANRLAVRPPWRARHRARLSEHPGRLRLRAGHAGRKARPGRDQSRCTKTPASPTFTVGELASGTGVAPETDPSLVVKVYVPELDGTVTPFLPAALLPYVTQKHTA